VIDDPAVDAVVIATRHGSHADLAARALVAGKHVFCEKPLALDEEELARVLEAARTTDRILLVGFNRRFAPLLRELRAILGDTRFVANYRISAGSLSPSSWIHDLDEGGGRIVGECCHFFDALTYLADAGIKAVAAAAVDDTSLPLQARQNVVVTTTFADGSVGTIAYVALGSAAVPKERLEVFAGEQTAILDDYRSLEVYGDEGTRRRRRGGRQDKGHRHEVRAFIDAIRSGALPVPLEEIENVSLATFAVIESLQSGATVRVRTIDH
jgi:predicted dehydrogenase